MTDPRNTGRAYPTHLQTNRFLRTPLSHPEGCGYGTDGPGSSGTRRLVAPAVSVALGAALAMTVHILFWH